MKLCLKYYYHYYYYLFGGQVSVCGMRTERAQKPQNTPACMAKARPPCPDVCHGVSPAAVSSIRWASAAVSPVSPVSSIRHISATAAGPVSTVSSGPRLHQLPSQYAQQR